MLYRLPISKALTWQTNFSQNKNTLIGCSRSSCLTWIKVFVQVVSVVSGTGQTQWATLLKKNSIDQHQNPHQNNNTTCWWPVTSKTSICCVVLLVYAVCFQRGKPILALLSAKRKDKQRKKLPHSRIRGLTYNKVFVCCSLVCCFCDSTAVLTGRAKVTLASITVS